MSEMAKKRKTVTHTKKKEGISFTSMHVFGKKLHPVWSLIGGIVMSPVGGIISIIGGIITIASLVALAAHYMNTNKK